MEERVRAIMADILMTDVMEIRDDASMDAIEQWDSLAHIELIVALEEEFEVKFEVEEFQMMKSFREIVETLAGKL